MKKWAFILIIPFVFYTACSSYQYKINESFQKRILPAQIELNGEYWASSFSGIRESCGAAIFGLSKKTIHKIGLKGLNYFAEMTQSKNGEKLSNWRVGKYSSFIREGREGVPIGVDCAYDSSFNFPYYALIKKRVRNSLFYVSYGKRGVLLVLPEDGLLVFSHDD